MYFRQILHEDRSCASYLVGCPTCRVCAAVDPQGDPSTYIDPPARNGIDITHVIDTHIHADHVSGARALAEVAGAPLFMGAGAEVAFDFSPLSDGMILEVGNRRIHVLHTPGHTPEHVSLLVDNWFVLTGDTLFVGDVGRVDLALTELDDSDRSSRAKELYASIQTLLSLRDDIEVYPGHYAGSSCGKGMDGKPSSTIGRERRMNLALQLDQDAFVAYEVDESLSPPDDYHNIKQANST